MYVTSVHNNDYIEIKAVDFKKGAKSFEMSAASLKGGKVELRLDDRNGTLIGICEVDHSDASGTWRMFRTNLKERKGVHNLFLVLRVRKANCSILIIGNSKNRTILIYPLDLD